MILQALFHYYETLLDREEISPPGWGEMPVTLALDLAEDGSLLGLLSLEVPRLVGKKEKLAPQSLRLPAPVKRTVGIAANFLCDNAAYMLGLDSKGKPERSRQCFIAAAELHLSLLAEVDSPTARAICNFFRSWDPLLAAEQPLLAPYLAKLQAGGNLIFQVNQSFAQSDKLVAAAWQRYYQQDDEGEEMVCLVTGQRAPIALIHPAIKKVRGAQAVGAALVAYNAPAYESFGHKGDQGLNGPVSKYAAFAYTTALNYLLASPEHCLYVGDTAMVFWAENGSPSYQDAYLQWLNGAAQESMNDNDLRAMMGHLAQGLTVNWQDETLDPQERFYILAIAPNAARLSVRFFLQNSFGAFAANIQRHYDGLEILRPAFEKRALLPPWRLLAETVNPNSRDKSPSPQLSGDLLRAILTGQRYPATLINGVMLRIRAESQIKWAKAAIIKAYWLRNSSDEQLKEVMQVELNENSEYVPYVLGQLFSVLEAVQQDSRQSEQQGTQQQNEQRGASQKRTTTLCGRYFTSAGTTPRVIFPQLIRLSNIYLEKIKKRKIESYIYYSKQITTLMGKLHEEFPARLSLQEQGAFQIGYYHETQRRYTPKGDKAKKQTVDAQTNDSQKED